MVFRTFGLDNGLDFFVSQAGSFLGMRRPP